MRHLLSAGTALLIMTSPLAAQGAAATLDRAVTAYKLIRTMRGTFEQTIRNPLTGSNLSARGEFQQQFPNRIAIRFSDPKGDLLIVDGAIAWLYLPSTNPGQAYKVPAAAGGSSLNIIEQFLTEPTTRYTVTSTGAAMVAGRATQGVKLVPKTPAREFTQATVWIDDVTGLIRQFEIVEPSGLVRRIQVTDATLNGPLAGDAFTFTPPKGVQVIDQTGGRG
jgi:outer membrane lipoprotein carrier protein